MICFQSNPSVDFKVNEMIEFQDEIIKKIEIQERECH